MSCNRRLKNANSAASTTPLHGWYTYFEIDDLNNTVRRLAGMRHPPHTDLVELSSDHAARSR